MKIQIRQGCFETNSSSTHAICIYRDLDIDGVVLGWNDCEYKIPYKPHKLYFSNSGEFDWQNKHYHSVEDKASYLWQCVVYCNLVDKLKNRIISVLKKYNITAQFAPTEKYNYGTAESPNYRDRFVAGNGYIDHGDETADLIIAICFNDRYLLNYLFNEDSFVATGNDNDGNLKIEDQNCYDNDRIAIFFKGN